MGGGGDTQSIRQHSVEETCDTALSTLVSVAKCVAVRTFALHIIEPRWDGVAGLLEGAHAGVGLGHEFLRHCQRCRVLVHVIDGTSPDPLGDYTAIMQVGALGHWGNTGVPQYLQVSSSRVQ